MEAWMHVYSFVCVCVRVCVGGFYGQSAVQCRAPMRSQPIPQLRSLASASYHCQPRAAPHPASGHRTHRVHTASTPGRSSSSRGSSDPDTTARSSSTLCGGCAVSAPDANRPCPYPVPVHSPTPSTPPSTPGPSSSSPGTTVGSSSTSRGGCAASSPDANAATRPSCPCVPMPQVSTRRPSVNAAAWRAPASSFWICGARQRAGQAGQASPLM
eukprot:199900-Chlamydomonas_euryale.AAC.7